MTVIFWAGDDESHQLVLQAEIKVSALLAQHGMTAGFMDSLMAGLPPLWSHEGGTAVVDISGPLIKGEAGFMRLFGVTGYYDIVKAASDAAMHEDTKALLFHINSPGGDVAGVIDAGNSLAQISSMKPSAVHTTDLMASAGYWLGASVKGQITAGPTAQVGSIGVLQIHRENSKQLAEMGITTTVLRSGEFKAEMNSVEPLSPDAKKRQESQLADVHGLFRAHIGAARTNLSSEDLAAVTEGQTFLGKRAMQAGLVDKIGSVGMALKLLDKQKHSPDTSRNSKGNAMLTPAQLAQIAAGTPLAHFGLNTDGTPMSAEEIVAYQSKVTADAAAAKVEEDRLAAEARANADSEVVAGLKAKLSTNEAALTLAQAELITLKASTATAAEQHTGLLAIARSATSNMLVPLAESTSALEGMDAAAVIAEHARLVPIFHARFKPGKQTIDTAATKPVAPSRAFLAGVKAQQSKK